MTIPASQIANVIPGVLSPGGAGLVMSGLVLTQNPLLGKFLALPAQQQCQYTLGHRRLNMLTRQSTLLGM